MTPRYRPTSTAFRAIMLVASAILASCEKPQVSTSEPPPPVVLEPSFPVRSSFPVDRILTDNQGRSFEATICGRVDQNIYIIRKSDGMKAIVPFSKLSPADFTFVGALPFEEPSSGFSRGSSVAAEKSKLSNRDKDFISTRKETIARLFEENEAAKIENASSTNGIRVRSNKSKIKRNLLQIQKLQADVDNFERNPK